MQERKSGNTWVVCGVIAMAVLCLGGIVAGIIGVGAIKWLSATADSNLSSQVSAPSNAAVGEEFDIDITVTNQGEADAPLEKIVLSDSLFSQVDVIAVSPQPESQEGSAFLYGLSIPSGQQQTILLKVRPRSSGRVSGSIQAFSKGEVKSEVVLEITFEEARVTTVQPAVVEATAAPAVNGEIAGVPYKAVVQILALVDMEGELQPGWSGSGSIISQDGLVLTNAHVVLSDRYYEVQGLVVCLTVKTDEQPVPTYLAKVLQVDQALDIAVIRIETDLDGNPIDPASLNLPTVPFGDDGSLNLGDPVTILGYPSIGGSTITLTRGEVAGFTAEEGNGNRAFIKTSATISGGNSGGLAANASGEIIGIPTQLGYGGDDQYVDCRVLADTNRDGVVDENDNCVPTGGFINALRPLHLAMPLIDAAKRGEINIKEGVEGQQGSIPEEQDAQTIYEDDFSDPNSGWDDSEWEDGAVHYVDGTYQVSVIPENWLVWSYLGDDYSDLIVSVDTAMVSPTGAGDFGVICRYVDDSNYYAFEVSEDGYFSIWKTENGETINLYDWEFSDSIPLNGVFTINAACAGNRLLFGVNDVLLADITDESFTKGKVGLIAGTLGTGGLTVAFDNFTVLEP